MKIAVIGGGTAGHIAAAHLTKYLPMVSLYHIYDPTIPSIGVGEGTTPPFVNWIHDVTGLTFEQLQACCDTTIKEGIRFENWGKKYPHYWNRFAPVEGIAYHTSSAKVVDLLKEYISATTISKRIAHIDSTGAAVHLTYTDQSTDSFDYLFDATGFPRQIDPAEHLDLSFVPTNEVRLYRTKPGSFQNATRAVARPYGWVFAIPLTHYTSYGYIFNNKFNQHDEIEADFQQFLAEQDAEIISDGRWLQFPNFTHRDFFDGSRFRIGNAASFLEPLEATAIGISILQVRLATHWLLDEILELSNTEKEGAQQILNNFLFETIQKVGLFLSWHYAQGSCFDTPFWDYAQQQYQRFYEELKHTPIGQEFDQYLATARTYPPTLGLTTTPHDIPTPPNALDKTFGGFLDVGFVQIANGIDFFNRASEA
ncbi:MAG TPA: tryptophan 7-halogenase [Anaerolineae bacterium]|nr:tryptophan 7-halogenase [Anaerolineae bacterium]